MLLALLVPMVGTAQTPGFTDTRVVAVPQPIALAFTPDGRMLVTSKGGRLYVLPPDESQPTVAINLSARICDNKERGLLGVAVDPDFGTGNNRRIYLYYTFKDGTNCPESEPTKRNPVNRVSAFTLRADNTVAPSSEQVLIDNIPSPNGNHNGGDLHFGPDETLYVSVGDGGCDLRRPTRCQPLNRNAREPHLLLGKILRITRNGGIPADNPFTEQGTARCNKTGRTEPGTICQEIYATGLRNPFRFAFDPNADGTRFFINDVGWQTWEEIDEGAAGANYGWNLREGPCPRGEAGIDCAAAPDGLTDPISAYRHTTDCQSITGGAFVPADAGWPSAYDGAYLYADFVCDTIFSLTPGGDDAEFRPSTGKPVHLTFGPRQGGQALYYTAFATDGSGEVRVISYTGSGGA